MEARQRADADVHGATRDIGPIDGFAVGTMRLVELGGRPILVANVDGRLFAVQGTCSHEGYPLDDGELDESTVTCGLHYSRFDLRDGTVLDPPAETPLVTHLVTVEDDRVIVRLSQDAAVE